MKNTRINLAVLSLPQRTQAVMEFFITKDGRNKFALSPEDKSDVAVFDFDNPVSFQHWQRYQAQYGKPGILLSVTEQKLPMTVWVQKPVTTQSMLEAATTISRSNSADTQTTSPAIVVSEKPNSLFNSTPQAKQDTVQNEREPDGLKLATLSLPKRTQAVMEFFISNEGRGKFVLSPEDKSDAAVFDFDNHDSLQHWQRYRSLLSKPGILLSVSEQRLPMTVWLQKPVSTQSMLDAAARIRTKSWTVESEISDAKIAAPEPQFNYKLEPESEHKSKQKTFQKSTPAISTPASESQSIASVLKEVTYVPDYSVTNVRKEVFGNEITESKRLKTAPTFADGFIEAASSKPEEEPVPVEPAVEPAIPSTFADEFIEAASSKPEEEPVPVEPAVESVIPSTFADEFIEAASSKPEEEPVHVEPAVEPVIASTFADEFIEVASSKPEEEPVPVLTIDPAPLPTPSKTMGDPTVTIEESLGTSSLESELKRNFDESPVVSHSTNDTTPVASTEEDLRYFGNRKDVSVGDIPRITNLFFNYEDKLISALRETYIVGNRWRSPTRLELNSGFLIFDPIEIRAYLDFPEEMLWDQLKIGQSVNHKISTVGIREYAEIQLKSESLTRIEQFDAFLWKSALLTSIGNLPSGTNLNKVFYLKYRPDMTHLQPIPHDQQIAELWAFRGASLLDTAKILGIPQRYVFAYYNATLAIDLITDDGKLRQEKPGGSVLSSIFKRLSH
jgi:hypothetical protein